MPTIGRNLFSVKTAIRNGIVSIVDSENPRLEAFGVTLPLRGKQDDLYSFVPDLRADAYGATELTMNAVSNAQLWHWRLGHLNRRSLEVMQRHDSNGITFDDKKIASLKKHGVYGLVSASSVPAGQKVVGSRWANKIKGDNLFKSHLVVLEWAQVPGIDCGGTFKPVSRLQSLRMMLAIADELDCEVLMLDVQIAFLNVSVEEEVYVKMAPGYETYDKSRVPFVMKLKTSFYGLRQSPRNWFGTMDDHLSNIGFRLLKSDPCVYVFEDMTGTVILTLYVDDILLLGNNKQLLVKLKKQLMDRFEMTDLGDVSKVLGMNVTRDRENGAITIDQNDSTEEILERYGRTNCNLAFTPDVGPDISLDQPAHRLLDEQGKRGTSPSPARLYLAQVPRYDILYAVNQLARAMSKPSKADMGAVKHVLRYLAGSVNSPITYKRGGYKITTYTDANWGGNPDNDKSTSAYIVMLANGPISFIVGLQSLTAQLTMEAELVAAATAMKGSFFCRNMMTELGSTGGFWSVPVYIDSTSALHVAGNRTFSPRAKHIALRYFFIQELVKEGKVTIYFVKTELQLADLGTKHLKNHCYRFSSSSSSTSSELEQAFYLRIAFVKCCFIVTVAFRRF